MHHANLEKLKSLRLFGMVRALQELTGLDDRGQLDFDDQLALLMSARRPTGPIPLWRCGSSAPACVRRRASKIWT